VESKLSPEQLAQLKAQVGAYKLLARQQPLPIELSALATKQPERKPTSLLPEPYQFPGVGDKEGEKLPYDLMKVLSIHQQRSNRSTTLPVPCGIDPQTVLKEREFRLVLAALFLNQIFFSSTSVY
jgi:SWI/SNF-related matrix-associated actin-dependent regulator of chromatin subfamily A protein 2/4